MKFRRNLRIVAVLAASIALCVSFENCAGGFNGQSSSDSLGLVTNSAASDPTPFAYDATFDTISYNSCFGAGAVTPAFYSLQAGAYDNGGGVNLTQEFIQYVNANLKPKYPATSITSAQVKDFLSQSPMNQTAMPQMAIRAQGNPQAVYPLNNSSIPVPNVDYITMLGDLTDDRWSDPLVTTAIPQEYFNLAPNTQRTLEGSINLMKDSASAQSFRNVFIQGGMLALTFTAGAPNNPYAARPVSSASDIIVPGHGFMLRFGQQVAPFSHYIASYAGAGPSSNTPESLTAITEVNLRAPASTVASWTCNPNRVYTIVRTRDAAQFCPHDNYMDTVNGITNARSLYNGMSARDYRRELEVVRRHLKTEYWDVSIEYRCAVPKMGSCYAADEAETDPNTGIAPQIVYDQTQPCFRADQSGNIATNYCAQTVSFCTRGAQ